MIKKGFSLFFVLFAVALFSQCDSDKNTKYIPLASFWGIARQAPVTMTVMPFNAITGAQIGLAAADITSAVLTQGRYSKTITAAGTGYGVIDTATGQLRFYDVDYYQDFVVYIQATGYQAYRSRSTSLHDVDIGGGTVVTGCDDGHCSAEEGTSAFIFDAPIFPTAMNQGISIRVADALSGAPITTGSYTLRYTAGAIVVNTAANRRLENGINSVNEFAISGTVAAGYITIPADTLIAGATYNVIVYNATGYANNTAVNFVAGTAVTGGDVVLVQMVPNTGIDPAGAIRIVYIEELNSAGQWRASATKTITIHFNQDFELDYYPLTAGGLNLGAAGYIAGVTTDCNHAIIPPVLAVQPASAVGSLPSGLSITRTAAATLQIAFTLTDTPGWYTTLDPGDDLYYTVGDTLLAGIRVRETSKIGTMAGFTSLKTGVNWMANDIGLAASVPRMLVRNTCSN